MHETNFSPTETPQFIAQQMIGAAYNIYSHNQTFLEPSAGRGNIAFEIRNSGVEPVCVELKQENVDYLQAHNFNVIHADFLKWTTPVRFDAIVMCPPRNSIPHVQHAISLLKPTGRLAALVRQDSPGLQTFIDFNCFHLLKPDNLFVMNGENVPSGIIVYYNGIHGVNDALSSKIYMETGRRFA